MTPVCESSSVYTQHLVNCGRCEDGKSPQVGTIISDALEAIDCSHRFGVDLTARNIVVTTKLNDINTDTRGL